MNMNATIDNLFDSKVYSIGCNYIMSMRDGLERNVKQKNSVGGFCNWSEKKVIQFGKFSTL